MLGRMTYYDTGKDEKERDGKLNNINYVAYFLEKILQDRQFYNESYTKNPVVTNFKFFEGDAPQEEDGLNDSGVWVARWMQTSYMWEGYVDEVNETTRMSLALDLVLGKENSKAEHVKTRAIITWDKIVGRAVTKLKRKKKKSADKRSKLSPSISF